jgi:pilus assembly protein CpaD
MTRTMATLPRSLVVALAAAMAATAGGCDRPRLSNVAAVELSNPEKAHPIGFSTHREVLEVEIPPSFDGLSSNQHSDVVRFLDRFRRSGKGKLAISLPQGVRGDAGAARSIREIQSAVADAGIDYKLVSAGRHARTNKQIVRLAYDRVTAEPPTCDRWPEDIGTNEERLTQPNFGCSTQRNIALMVNTPRDLIKPQPEDERSSERRSVTWSSYIGQSSGGGAAGADPASTKNAKRGGSGVTQ